MSLQERWIFLKEFGRRREATGSVTPSSRFLAWAVTAPLRGKGLRAQILEVGAGTGAFTREIVRQLGAGDRLVIYESNPALAKHLLAKTAGSRGEVEIIMDRITGLPRSAQFDFAISGLPLNNFQPEEVDDFFRLMGAVLRPAGILSFFEYLWLRRVGRRLGKAASRARLQAVDQVFKEYVQRFEVDHSLVPLNIPPAIVRHLRFQ